MATTFREFITECELYEYSKEYYELMKEGYELDLMGMYIRNQEFLKEDVPMLEAAGMTVSATYFAEAAADTDFAAITEAFGKKKEGLISRIIEMIKGLLKKFTGFLRKRKEAKFGKLAVSVEDITNGKIPAENASNIISGLKKVGVLALLTGVIGVSIEAIGRKSVKSMEEEIDKAKSIDQKVSDEHQDQINRKFLKRLVHIIDSGVIKLPVQDQYCPSNLFGMDEAFIIASGVIDGEYSLTELRKKLSNPVYSFKTYTGPSFTEIKSFEDQLSRLNDKLTNLSEKMKKINNDGKSVPNEIATKYSLLNEVYSILAKALANVVKLEQQGIQIYTSSVNAINGSLSQINQLKK